MPNGARAVKARSFPVDVPDARAPTNARAHELSKPDPDLLLLGCAGSRMLPNAHARIAAPPDVEALIEEAGAAKARAESSAEILTRTEKLAEPGAVAPDALDRARHQAE